ncbi:NAD(P)/FAD-dependent oxidoreductase [Vagococcus vulneris]|uniref:FAD dependent oxidoreductase domain-containing protein n=1 Tax=Vagococcus vulneris TaxID=1977869 RepID=A0A429ZT57_9ENTE|nr:FAD-binding oxidoreductase [Vagococcus vulneris]RST96915.1 hypothetical protein CBF37_10505 [Vagococcus vulneris]
MTAETAPKIAVIGGGIVGSTAAFYLNRHQQHVVLFDEGIGQATKAAAGIISPWLSQRRNKDWYFLAKSGAAFYTQLMLDLNLPQNNEIYRKTGTILYKKDHKLLDKLTKIAEKRALEAPEIGTITQLTAAEIKEKLPLISSNQPGLFVSGGAKVDGAALTKHLQNTLPDVKKERITVIKLNHQGQWILLTKKRKYIFDHVILCAGAWLPELLSPLGFDVDIRPQKGQLIELSLSQEKSFIEAPVAMPVGEIDLIPFSDQQIIIGATHENDMGYDLTPDFKLLEHMKQTAGLWAEKIKNEPIASIRIGTRAYTSDFLPFFGEVDLLPNLMVASGLGSSGLTTGPIIGKTLADWVLGNPTKLDSYKKNPNNYIQKT